MNGYHIDLLLDLLALSVATSTVIVHLMIRRSRRRPQSEGHTITGEEATAVEADLERRALDRSRWREIGALPVLLDGTSSPSASAELLGDALAALSACAAADEAMRDELGSACAEPANSAYAEAA